MSRVGTQPITIPDGVKVKLQDNKIEVKGTKATLSRELPEILDYEVSASEILVKRRNEEWLSKSMHGLTRTLVANMVIGVSEGFKKELEIQGRGYRASVAGKTLTLELGFSHPVLFPIPDGIDIAVEGNTNIAVTGADKELIGQVAAKIRAYRKPEPYQGKGVRYRDEYVARKDGKKNV